MQVLVSRIERMLPRKRLDIFGKDSLMKTSLPYYIIAIMTVVGLPIKLPNPFPFIAIIYAGFPILDEIFSLDERNPDQQERKQL